MPKKGVQKSTPTLHGRNKREFLIAESQQQRPVFIGRRRTAAVLPSVPAAHLLGFWDSGRIDTKAVYQARLAVNIKWLYPLVQPGLLPSFGGFICGQMGLGVQSTLEP